MTILYLTFYFEPDLCPGSFRNTSLVNELSGQLTPADSIQVITTQPNRYSSYKPAAAAHEERSNNDGTCSVTVQRIEVPGHNSGLMGQVWAFLAYFRAVHQLADKQEYDLVVASSSRLFTAFLGARLSKKRNVPLFLDIRDLFREAIGEVIRFPLIRGLLDVILRAVERYTFGYAAHINLISAGFRSYFKPYTQATYSYLTNGIDTNFLTTPDNYPPTPNRPYRTILYAGNIGDGQGLHKLIPEASRQLGNSYRFVLIGDGGAKHKLQAALRKKETTNVELRSPCHRNDLVADYQSADYLLVHLNDWDACLRVLPSKLFEYGATNKPILAGVAGYAASFVREHLPNSILFNPTDADDLVRQLRETPHRTLDRPAFREQFGRDKINQELARLIILTQEQHSPASHRPVETLFTA